MQSLIAECMWHVWCDTSIVQTFCFCKVWTSCTHAETIKTHAQSKHTSCAMTWKLPNKKPKNLKTSTIFHTGLEQKHAKTLYLQIWSVRAWLPAHKHLRKDYGCSCMELQPWPIIAYRCVFFLFPLLAAAAVPAATGARAALPLVPMSRARIASRCSSVFCCELPSLNKVGLKGIAILKRVLGGQVLRIVTVDKLHIESKVKSNGQKSWDKDLQCVSSLSLSIFGWASEA